MRTAAHDVSEGLTMDLDQTALERLRGTLACDAMGRPLVLHHGTPFEFDRFERTADIGFHFGTIEQALYREWEGGKGQRKAEWRIQSVAITAKKVLVYPDDPKSWLHWAVIDDLCRMTNPAWLETMRNEGVDTVQKALVRVRQFLRDDGYDAVVYRNMCEGSAKHLEWSWCVLDADDLVMLGDLRDKSRLMHEIGDASHPLPTDLKKVPAVLTKANALKFAHDKRAFLERMRSLCSEQGLPAPVAQNPGWQKPTSDTYVFEIVLGGVRCQATADVEGGNLKLMPDDLAPGALDDMMCRDIVWYGMKPIEGKKTLSFQWLPGIPLDRFMDDVVARMEAVAERNQQPSMSNAA